MIVLIERFINLDTSMVFLSLSSLTGVSQRNKERWISRV